MHPVLGWFRCPASDEPYATEEEGKPRGEEDEQDTGEMGAAPHLAGAGRITAIPWAVDGSHVPSDRHS
jgi:hypothetical protein